MPQLTTCGNCCHDEIQENHAEENQRGVERSEACRFDAPARGFKPACRAIKLVASSNITPGWTNRGQLEQL